MLNRFSVVFTSDTINPVLKPILDDFTSLNIWGKVGKYPQNSTNIGLFKDKELIRTALFHNYDPETQVIELSMAGTDHGFSFGLLMLYGFEYAFKVCNAQMVYSRISTANNHINTAYGDKFVSLMGGNKTVIPRLYGREADGLLLSLSDDAWYSSKLYNRMQNRQASAVFMGQPVVL